MACVQADGSLSENGMAMLRAIVERAHTAEEIAEQTGLPLYRVRSGMRELVGAGLATGSEDAYKATEAGSARAA